jgi:folate/biopterin transporter
MEKMSLKEKMQFIEKMKYNNRISYLLISFNQGLGSISELAVQYYFKDELHLEPARLSQIYSFILIPWTIKPLFGMITDLFPIMGYRRKLYTILCGLMCIISWLAMSFLVNSLYSAILCLLLINVCVSFSTVLGEAVVVELSQLEKVNSSNHAKDYVSLFFFCKYFGALLSSYMKGLLVEVLSIRSVFLIASFLPWLIVSSGLLLIEVRIKKSEDENYINLNLNGNTNTNEVNTANNNYNYTELAQNKNFNEKENKEKKKNELDKSINEDYENNNNNNNEEIYHSIFNPSPPMSPKELLILFKDFLMQKYVFVPTIFIILLMATPSYGDPYFYYLTNHLKFSASLLGKISFCSTLCTLIAIWLYKTFFKDTNFRLMITIGTITSFFFSFMAFLLVRRVNIEFGISDFWFVLLSSSLLSMIGELVMMPMLSLACLLCPKNLEGTVYAMFMSALNFGGILSGLLGSFLTTWLNITAKNYDNLDKLILIANILTLCPLPFLLWINDSYFEPKEEKEKEKENNINREKDIVSYDYNNNNNDNNISIKVDKNQNIVSVVKEQK